MQKNCLKQQCAKFQKKSASIHCQSYRMICLTGPPLFSTKMRKGKRANQRLSQMKEIMEEQLHLARWHFSELNIWNSPCTLIPGRGLLNANCIYYLRHKHLNLSILLLSPPHGSLRSHVLAHSHYSTLSFPLGDFFPEIFKCKLNDWSMCHLSRRISFCFSLIKDEKSLLGRLNSRSSSGNGITWRSS